MKTGRSILIISLLMVLLIVGWQLRKSSVSGSNNKVWVYIEIQKILVRDTSDYYYYGQIKESVLEKFNNNENVKGVFTLSNIRYWNDNDLFQIYENDERSDYKIFQLSDIQYISPYKVDPILLFEEEKLHESALKLKSMK